MKITVDPKACQGHARCNALHPDLFELDDLGYSIVRDLEIPAGQEDRVDQVIRVCPERAIAIAR
jgi:ferredoxin